MGLNRRPMSRRPYALLSYGRGIVMFAASMIFLIWAGAYWVSEREIANDTENAFSQASNLSRLYADTISRSLRTTDQFIKRVRRSLDEPGFDLYAWARNSDFNPASGDVVQISVADASGRMLASTLTPGPFDIDISDRPDFREQKASTGDTLVVSDPEYGVISNRTIVKVTRPIRKPDGEFAGVVIASVAPDALTKVFRQVDLGPNGAAMVTGAGTASWPAPRRTGSERSPDRSRSTASRGRATPARAASTRTSGIPASATSRAHRSSSASGSVRRTSWRSPRSPGGTTGSPPAC